MLGHTTNISNPIKAGGVLNANSRVVLEEKVRLGTERCWQPLCLLSCRAGSKWRAGNGTEGTLAPCAGVCTGATQHLSVACVERRNLNALRRMLARLKFPGERQSQEEIIPLSHCPKWHRQVPSQKERAHRRTDRQTDSLPHSLHLPGKVGVGTSRQMRGISAPTVNQ